MGSVRLVIALVLGLATAALGAREARATDPGREASTQAAKPGPTSASRRKARALYAQAWELTRNGSYGSAARLLRQAEKLDPEDAAVEKLLGTCLERLDRREEAAAHLRRFLELAPDDPVAPEVRSLVADLERGPEPTAVAEASEGEEDRKAPAADRRRAAHEKYLQAYASEARDPEAARLMYEEILRTLGPDDEDFQKAKHRLERLSMPVDR